VRVRTPLSSQLQDNPPVGLFPRDNRRSQSVQAIFDHLHVQDDVEDTLGEDEMADGVKRSRRRLGKVTLAAILLVILGAGGLSAVLSVRSPLSGRGSGPGYVLSATLTGPEHAPSARLASRAIDIAIAPHPLSLPARSPHAEVAIPQPASLPLPSLPTPEPILASPQVRAEDVVSVSLPTLLSPSANPAVLGKLRSPRTDLMAAPETIEAPGKSSGTSPRPEVAVSPAPSAGPKPALQTSPVAAAPVEEPLKVRLSFTADQSEHAAALAAQLRREGFEVISIVIPVTHGRWPGVAFFFNSDREKARMIARQLAVLTGRKEHARLSPRHPYLEPGTVEVSLLSTTTSGGRTSGKRAHTQRLP
jgi:hypothetical protein